MTTLAELTRRKLQEAEEDVDSIEASRRYQNHANEAERHRNAEPTASHKRELDYHTRMMSKYKKIIDSDK